ncbi:non-canonical purine NTP diphosphatase [Litoribacter alkaliphilus]|uniref:dITP/XTP pyrophosphatase n=1 Tax=Litoribacter ruber TaxID=702568 RepID=A0AAP2G4C8_9BACT|nr:non-canonical purine NTP diphosphatase [Litoribacter alkaliphilus]MBS9524360.1 non-canonical purine NTP diphosphatase [Litoribacter alkaliphilus]
MKICFATNNPKKIEEVKAALGENYTLLSLKDIGCEVELPETGDTLEYNAFEKARYVYDNYGVSCFADDTGLEVEALDNAPGVYSGRFAGEPRSDERNIDLLLEKLKGHANRSARFRTVIALILEGEEHKFEGIAQGEITVGRSGEKGFGYDSVFKPADFEVTFAEMSLEDKNQISHRGQAVEKLADFLHSYF